MPSESKIYHNRFAVDVMIMNPESRGLTYVTRVLDTGFCVNRNNTGVDEIF